MRSIAFLVVLFLTTVTSNHLDNLESLYPAYKLIEEAVKANPIAMFKIKQTFFPSTNYRYWQVDGVEVIRFRLCVTLNDTQQTQWIQTNVTKMNESDINKNCTMIWDFQWTNSLLLNIIPGDIFLAMDVTLSNILYSEISDSSSYRKVFLDVYLNLLSPVNMDDLEQAVVLFLSTVCSIVKLPSSRHL